MQYGFQKECTLRIIESGKQIGLVIFVIKEPTKQNNDLYLGNSFRWLRIIAQHCWKLPLWILKITKRDYSNNTGNTLIKEALMGVERSGNVRAAIKMSKGGGQCKAAWIQSPKPGCASQIPSDMVESATATTELLNWFFSFFFPQDYNSTSTALHSSWLGAAVGSRE